VPLTVVNDSLRLEGAVPESQIEAELRILLAEAKTA
jgi:hypothetical protein